MLDVILMSFTSVQFITKEQPYFFARQVYAKWLPGLFRVCESGQ